MRVNNKVEANDRFTPPRYIAAVEYRQDNLEDKRLWGTTITQTCYHIIPWNFVAIIRVGAGAER